MESIRELKYICWKSPEEHRKKPLYTRFIRHLSIYITWLLLHTSITANQVTVLQIIAGIAGAICLAANRLIPGIILLQLGYILDCVDGEVARYRRNPSLSGVSLDMAGHFIVTPLMYFGFALGIYLKTHILLFLILGFFSSLFALPIVSLAIDHVVMNLLRKDKMPQIKSSIDSRTAGHADKNRGFKKQFFASSILRAIEKKINIWMKGYLGGMNAISLAVILDLLFPIVYLRNIQISFKIILLIFFGVYVPLMQILSLFWSVKHKRIEGEIIAMRESGK